MTFSHLRFGTRGSDLALWQTRHVMNQLQAACSDLTMEYQIISTRGDRVLDTPLPLVGGKGVFTAELEAALYEKRIEGAVHSLKDLPTEQPQGLALGAILARANPADALISRAGYTLETLPQGAAIGTSSTRRAAQLLNLRPDLKLHDIRGNVDTRIRKALDPDGAYDAILLACAGLERLGLQQVIAQVIAPDVMIPAPGQGAIAVQTRDDADLKQIFAAVHHVETGLSVTAERAFLAGLGGGCSVPVAAYAQVSNGEIRLRGRVSAPDGSQQIDVQASTAALDEQSARMLGAQLAQQALNQGAQALMEPRG